MHKVLEEDTINPKFYPNCLRKNVVMYQKVTRRKLFDVLSIS